MIVPYILLALLILLLLFLAFLLLKLKTGNKRVDKELKAFSFNKLPDIGAVESLSVLPLVDFLTDDSRLKTEPGVSYLIKADGTTILMDVGLNRRKEHPSPLLHNMKTLGLSLDAVDAIFITHLHVDHVGGLKEQRKGLFSLSQGKTKLSEIPVYSPVEIAPSEWNPGPVVRVIKAPVKLREGIASIGTIPRNLFGLGLTLENSLAVNLRGKGIVLIVGCGHQTIERILERTQALFDEPIYGIIGGLHYPVHGGRVMAGPFNIQSFATDRPPWKGINEEDVINAIKRIKEVGPPFISLSPHDSSDWSIEQFRTAFKDQYHDLRVGRELRLF